MPTPDRTRTLPPSAGEQLPSPTRMHRPLVAVLVALTALGPALGLAARLQAPADPSPATGDAQVVAHGVVPLGDAELAWRVVRGSAPPPANAVEAETVAGFLLADDGALLVEEVDGGEQTRLAAGEAVLTRAGARQVRAALGANAVSYYTIELVAAATAGEAGDGELRYAGDPFAVPAASHDLDLVRDVLDPGESTELPSGAAPTLVLATAGAVDVATAAGEVIRLPVGEAIALTGPLVLTAAEQGAVVVAAVVGPAVPRLTGPAASPPAAPPPAAPPADGTPAAATTPETGVAAEPAATPDDAAAPAAPIDTDGDGLNDDEELALNTDPTVVDTDGDGLTDGEEVLTYGTAPLAPDTDGDGFLDGDEVAQGTDPLNPASFPGAPIDSDSDGDGLPDSIELELGTDPSDVDTDDDGLTDGDEYYIYATGTRNPDTDGDGVLDGDEVANGTDPNDPTDF